MIEINKITRLKWIVTGAADGSSRVSARSLPRCACSSTCALAVPCRVCTCAAPVSGPSDNGASTVNSARAEPPPATQLCKQQLGTSPANKRKTP